MPGPAAGIGVRGAYQRCEQIMRQQAKNFSYGITLLPGDKRRALSAVYAYARRIDDIGDGTMPPDDKLAALERARAEIRVLAGEGTADLPRDPVLIALKDAASRFRIPVTAFCELIDGCEADVRGTSYLAFGELSYYCRCVAGSIGRLSLGVFGSSDPASASGLADALGVALQLTNILRDIKEDLENGRVYLPAEDLDRFGCTLVPPEPGAGAVMEGDLAGLIRFEAERAKEWYATGLRLLGLLDRRSAACTGAMAGIYARLLDHIYADPAQALDGRMSLPSTQKALVAATAIAGMARRPRPGGAAAEVAWPASALEAAASPAPSAPAPDVPSAPAGGEA